MNGAQLRITVLWVLLALLPLRGWAAGLMAADGWPVGPAVPAQVSAPCHGVHEMAQEPQEPQASTAMEAGAWMSTFCGDCDLCHAPMAFTGAPALAPFPQSDGPPEAHARDTGRLMASWLERPPRP